MGGLTKRKKSQAYLSDEIAEKLDQERQQSGLTESKLIEKILAERYGLAESASESAINPEIEDRLKYLENKLLEVIGVYEQTSAYLDSRINSLAKNVSGLDVENLKERLNDLEQLEDLSELCATNFRLAFKRIGRLERGERVNDLGLDESVSESQAESAKTQELIVKLAKDSNASEVVITASFNDEAITLKQVAESIGLSYKRLIATRKEKGDRFLEYLHEKSGKVWEFDPKADRYGKYRIVDEL